MRREMALRGFSPATHKAYVASVRHLVKYVGRSADKIQHDDIKRYLVHLAQERQVAFSTFNLALSGIRFFYKSVLGREEQFGAIVYQRAPQKLPLVLSRQEAEQLLEAAVSLRDRALLECAYGAGLRVSEVVRLRVTDIDSQRMQIRVEQGKGRKDRSVMLPERLLATLRQYWRACKPRLFLFPGAAAGRPSVVGRRRAAHLQQGARGVATPQARHHPHVASQLCHTPGRGGGQRAGDPGAARPPQPADHAALHPPGRQLPA